MEFQNLRPIIWTHDIEASIQFYTKILDFKIGEYNLDWKWASLYHNNVEIMLSAFLEQTNIKEPTFTGSFYFNVLDVESVWDKLKDKVTICYEIETFEWGMREFAIFDNNGYVLQFGEEIKKT